VVDRRQDRRPTFGFRWFQRDPAGLPTWPKASPKWRSDLSVAANVSPLRGRLVANSDDWPCLRNAPHCQWRQELVREGCHFGRHRALQWGSSSARLGYVVILTANAQPPTQPSYPPRRTYDTATLFAGLITKALLHGYGHRWRNDPYGMSYVYLHTVLFAFHSPWPILAHSSEKSLSARRGTCGSCVAAQTLATWILFKPSSNKISSNNALKPGYRGWNRSSAALCTWSWWHACEVVSAFALPLQHARNRCSPDLPAYVHTDN
jgi:hypothetical protein